jgi:hyperosmotically inducible periplasmic protein
MKLSVISALAILAAGPIATPVFAHSTATAQAKLTDEEMSNLIAKNIASDKTLAADALNVSVKNGVATLTGVVGKEADKASAERIARAAGATRVVDHLTSREKAGDKAKGTAEAVGDATKKGAKKTEHAVSKTGEAITDTWISTRIKGNLAGEVALKGSDVKVDVKDHVVTLSGTVPDHTAHARALTIGKEVEGVDRVVDKLTVGPKVEK